MNASPKSVFHNVRASAERVASALSFSLYPKHLQLIRARERELLDRMLERYGECFSRQEWPAFEAEGVFTPVQAQPWMTAALGASAGYFALEMALPPQAEAA